MNVDIIFPCLDEAAALPWLLDRIPAGFRAIVIDNGSTDDSAAIAEGLGATVIREPRRGFGAACHAGLLAATSDIVAFSDADGSLDPLLLPRVVEPIADGTCDLMLGRRRASTWGAWPLHARLGNAAVSFSVRRKTGARVTDIGPMRAANRQALLDLELQDRRFGYPLEMVVRAAEQHWRIGEVDIDYVPRTGKSKVTGTLSGTMRAVKDMRRVLASIS